MILYFYPKDDTPGCTRKPATSRRSLPKFKPSKAAVLGVSILDEKSKAKFADKHGITFPLLADADHAIADKYGVWQEKSLYGRKFMGIARTTYLIDADGKVSQRWDNVKVDGHVDAVARRASSRFRMRLAANGTPCSACASPSSCCRARRCRAGRAQVDFTGQWAPLYHEDTIERIPGPELGDYTGLPLNEAGRLRAESWDADRISVVQEYQCRPHSSDYALRGLAPLRVAAEYDPGTQRIVAFDTHIGAYENQRTILPRRPAASAGLCRAYLPGLLHRRVGRQHAHHHDDAPQGELPAAQRRAAQLQGDVRRALGHARPLPDDHPRRRPIR